MTTATATSKGQVTIPLDIRERLGIAQGVKLDFVAIDDTRCEIVVKNHSIMELAGMFAHDGPARTVDDMDDAIGEAVAADHERIRRGGPS